MSDDEEVPNFQKRSLNASLEALRHSSECDAILCERHKCRRMKMVMSHLQVCDRTKDFKDMCQICKNMLQLCLCHAQTCTVKACPIMLCSVMRSQMQKWEEGGLLQGDIDPQLQRMLDQFGALNAGDGRKQQILTEEQNQSQTTEP
ncbi:hypothetical protein L596_010650 [Steinernema carpocapsae]|uniref:histone acetyltransferase n=1 Tax=Steinernema carpocapsae TaxID=34508 RepID=A0A4U5PKK7_STECR|nr:hypothetical protein L596_010650 [Steinernema carpocapsae]